MTSVLSSKKKDYFKTLLKKPDIRGIHDSETEFRGELGLLMKRLKDREHSSKIYNIISKIYKILSPDNITYEDFKKQYVIYLNLLEEQANRVGTTKCYRKLGEVDNLSKIRWNHWASIKQFIFGKCVVDALNISRNYSLHPIWGALLSPTGGITGPGNKEILAQKWNSYISLHSSVHDACGYLYNYHKIGPGYNYLNKPTIFPRFSPLSGQYWGLKFWRKLIDEKWTENK